MNFVTGIVRGGKLALPALGGRMIASDVTLPSEGAEVTVGLRPQDLRLTNGDTATLELREQLGPVAYDHLICADGAKIIVETRGEDDWSEGSRVGLDFNDADVLLFNAKTEARLR